MYIERAGLKLIDHMSVFKANSGQEYYAGANLAVKILGYGFSIQTVS